MRTCSTGPAAGSLFADLPSCEPRRTPVPRSIARLERGTEEFEGQMLQEIASAFERAKRPDDPESVFEALMAGVEHGRPLEELGADLLPAVLSGDTLLRVPQVVKKVFDFYFRDDLYGQQILRDPIILSSGSYDESVFGLPASLKECIRYALEMNWCGYSNSLGRASAREALARLETVRSNSKIAYDVDNIAITMGGTAAVGSIVDLIVEHATAAPHAVACVPNYPPLAASMARRLPTALVPTPLRNGRICVEPLLHALRGNPTVVLLQTVVNPWGRRVAEGDLARVVAALPPGCYLVLDECHDVVGPTVEPTLARSDERVISLRSLSKRWAAPGLKAGWMVGSKDFLELYYHHASTTYGGPGSLLYLMLEMFALFEAVYLSGVDLGEQRGHLRREYGVATTRLDTALADYLHMAQRMAELVVARREHATERLRSAGIPVLTADYSINVTARLGDMPSYALYRRLVAEAGVSVLPGLLTMSDSRGVVRLSPCLNESVLNDGLDRLVAWYQCRY